MPRRIVERPQNRVEKHGQEEGRRGRQDPDPRRCRPPRRPRWAPPSARTAWRSWTSARSTTPQTEAQRGTIVPVEITIYEDRSFTFITKTPPTLGPDQARPPASTRARQTPAQGTVGKITDAQVTEIAQIKMPDLNANDLDAAKPQVAGTARSMGIDVV